MLLNNYTWQQNMQYLNPKKMQGTKRMNVLNESGNRCVAWQFNCLYVILLRRAATFGLGAGETRTRRKGAAAIIFDWFLSDIFDRYLTARIIDWFFTIPISGEHGSCAVKFAHQGRGSLLEAEGLTHGEEGDVFLSQLCGNEGILLGEICYCHGHASGFRKQGDRWKEYVWF